MSAVFEKQTSSRVEFGQIREPIDPTINQLVFTPSPSEMQTLFDSDQIPQQFLMHEIGFEKPAVVFDSDKDLPLQLDMDSIEEEYPDEDYVYQGTLDFLENGADFRSASVNNTRRSERLRRRMFSSPVV